YQWNTPGQNELLEEADFILVLDSDVPWIPFKNKPSDDAVIYYIDEDPLKDSMPLWYIPSRRFFAADAETALVQLNEALEKATLNNKQNEQRRKEITSNHEQQKLEKAEAEKYPDKELTPEYVLACVREVVDEDTIVTNELISSYQACYDHLNMTKPGSIFGSG